MLIIVILSGGPVEPDWTEATQFEAEGFIHMLGRMGIKRIRETAAPDENGTGCFVLEIEYDSINADAKATFVS